MRVELSQAARRRSRTPSTRRRCGSSACGESTYWLGLGSNLGDRLANLQGLVDALRDAGVRVEALSPVYDTAPQQIADQPAFLNAVVRVRTELTPRELLAVAKRAERRLGRSRRRCALRPAARRLRHRVLGRRQSGATPSSRSRIRA